MFVGVWLLPPASVQTGDHLPLSGAHRVIFYFSTRESHHCWTGAPIAVLSGIRTGLGVILSIAPRRGETRSRIFRPRNPHRKVFRSLSHIHTCVHSVREVNFCVISEDLKNFTTDSLLKDIREPYYPVTPEEQDSRPFSKQPSIMIRRSVMNGRERPGGSR